MSRKRKIIQKTYDYIKLLRSYRVPSKKVGEIFGVTDHTVLRVQNSENLVDYFKKERDVGRKKRASK